MEGGDHGRLGYASDQAFIHCRSCCDAQTMAIQTSFAEKVTRPQNGDYGFLALFGNHRELELAFLDVENGVRRRRPARKQFDRSDISLSSFPRQPWREISWERMLALSLPRRSPLARRSRLRIIERFKAWIVQPMLGIPAAERAMGVAADCIPRLSSVSCKAHIPSDAGRTHFRRRLLLTATGYQFLRQPPPQLPPQLLPPRTSLIISKSSRAPIVALMIAATMPTPRWMPSCGISHSPMKAPMIPMTRSPMIPNPVPRTIWPANHPATRPTTKYDQADFDPTYACSHAPGSASGSTIPV